MDFRMIFGVIVLLLFTAFFRNADNQGIERKRESVEVEHLFPRVCCSTLAFLDTYILGDGHVGVMDANDQSSDQREDPSRWTR